MADKHQPDSINCVQMGIRHKQGMPMQSQFEQAILDVYDFCMREKEAGVPIIPLNHFSKRVCELLKISDSSVKRVLRKRENGEPLAPVKRTRNRKSPVTDIDDYTRDAIARKVHAYNYQDKHFTMAALLEECKQDLGFKGCEGSLRAILQKQLGFVFRKIDNKLKLEQKKIIKKKKIPKQEKLHHQPGMLKKIKKVKQHSVPVQTQTMQVGPVNTVEIRMTQTDNGNMDHLTTMHAIPVHRQHPGMEEIQMRHQGHQTDTIEHMALSGLVAHRTNVIENMAMAHRANEMAMQQQQQQQQQHRTQHTMDGLTVLKEYRQ